VDLRRIVVVVVVVEARGGTVPSLLLRGETAIVEDEDVEIRGVRVDRTGGPLLAGLAVAAGPFEPNEERGAGFALAAAVAARASICAAGYESS
jgi:hypothetical protein